MIEGSLPDEWYCNVCKSARQPRLREDDAGTFGQLLFNLDRSNPVAFRLPESIRDYFVDVNTGAEGEYEEGGPPKAK